MAIMTKKESKFLDFTSLTSLFNKHKDQISIDKEKINRKVSVLLDSAQYALVFDYMIAGYLLDEKQKEKLLVDIYQKVSREDSLKIVNNAVNKGVHLSDDIWVRLLPIFKLSEHPGDYFKAMAPEFNKIYKERLESLDFAYYYNQWENEVKEFNKKVNSVLTKPQANTLDNITTLFTEYKDYMFKNIDLDIVMEHIDVSNKIYKKLKKSEDYNGCRSAGSDECKRNFHFYKELNHKYAKFNRELSQLPGKLYANDLENDKKKIGLLYSEDNINQLIAENDLKISSQNNVKNLPANAKNILDEIKDDYLALNKKITDLNDDEKFTIENMWQKRIPEVLNKYLRADPEFRSTMKNNQGQSIEDLMIDSLNNIHTTFKDIKVTHGENALRDMSAINRYTKTLKK